MAPPRTDSQLDERFALPIIGWVDGAFGMVLFASYVSMTLYGIFLNQAFKYFRTYKAEALWVKGIVITAVVLETGVTAIHVHLAYYYLMENYGNPWAFLRGVWSLNIFPIFTAGIMINCQSFYTVRILMVGPSKYSLWLVVAIIVLMGGMLGLCIVSTFVGFRGITIENYGRLLWLVLAYNAVASGADLILTTTLIYILHHNRTGFKSTDSIINRLILYAVSTGLITTIFNIISFILVHLYGIRNWAWLGTIMIAERLYSNSLMVALNSRKTANKQHEDDDRYHTRDDASRAAEPYGTAVRASTRRFDNSLGMNSNETIELPQVESEGVISIEATRSEGDVKMHPFGDVAET